MVDDLAARLGDVINDLAELLDLAAVLVKLLSDPVASLEKLKDRPLECRQIYYDFLVEKVW